MTSTDKSAERGLKALARYVALEKRVGRSGGDMRACRIAMHVYRACRLYGYTFNPYG
jgi:hypothetical protein